MKQPIESDYLKNILDLSYEDLQSEIEESIHYKIELKKKRSRLDNQKLIDHADREYDELIARLSIANAVMRLKQEAGTRELSIVEGSVCIFNERYFACQTVHKRSKFVSLFMYAYGESLLFPSVFYPEFRAYINAQAQNYRR